MKKLSLKTLTILALSFTMLISLSIGLFSVKEQVLADSIEIPAEKFEDDYMVGDILVLPTTINIGGLEYKNGVVTLPDVKGTQIPAVNITLTTAGNYTVRYYYTAPNGKITVAERVIPVKNNAYTLSNYEEGSVVYASTSLQAQVKNEFPQDAKESVYIDKVPFYSNDYDTTRTGKDALIVRLANSNEFTYSQPIDLRNQNENGLSDILEFDLRQVQMNLDTDWNHRELVIEEILQNVIVPKLGYSSIETVEGQKVLGGYEYPLADSIVSDKTHELTSEPYGLFQYYLKLYDANVWNSFKFTNLNNVYKDKNGKVYTADELRELYTKMDEDNLAANPAYAIGDLNTLKYKHFRENFVADEDLLRVAIGDENIGSMPNWSGYENVTGILHYWASKIFYTSESLHFGGRTQYTNTKITNRVTVFKLTDAHDPSRYVEIKAYVNGEDGKVTSTVFTAAGTAQKFYGLQADTQRQWEWTGDIKMLSISFDDKYDGNTYDWYRRWDGTGRGRDIPSYSGAMTAPVCKLQYDLETNSIYVLTSQISSNSLTFGNYSTPKLINALSNEVVYGTGGGFGGFTTGEVYLSVRMEEYLTEDQSRLDIYSIGQKTGSELVSVNNNDQQLYADTIKPELTINVLETDNVGVYAPVGKDFVLPSATAYDLNLVGDYSVNVYSWYGTPQQRIVELNNGKFKVADKTKYTAVYTAVDYFGNQVQKTLDIIAKDTLEDYFVLDANFDGISLSQGVKFILPESAIETLNNKNFLDVQVYAVNVNETIYVDMSQENPGFIPKYAGEYVIVFECSDNLIKGFKIQVPLDCGHSDAVTFSNEFNLPRFFVKNRYYSFDKIFAYTYNYDEPTQQNADFKVSFDGGEFVRRSATRFLIDANQTVQLKYSYNGVELVSEVIPVIDAGYLSSYNEKKDVYEDYIMIKKYFYGDIVVDDYKKDGNGNILTNSLGKPVETSDLLMKSTVSSGDNVIQFVNEFEMEAFSVKFNIPENYSQFNKLDFVLIDSVNNENKLVLSYTYGQEKSESSNGVVTWNDYVYFSINGEVKGKMKSKFAGVDYNIYYDTIRKQFIVTGASTVYLDVDINWFTTTIVDFDIVICGIYGKNSGLLLKELCSTTLMINKHKDTINPTVIVQKQNGQYNINDQITLYKPKFMDLYSGVNMGSAKFTVTYNGVPVPSVDGTVLDGNQDWNKDYTIKLSSLGKYTVTYTCEDNAGNKLNYSYDAVVIDSVAPIINVANGYDEKTIVYVKLGQVFEYDYSVIDDSDYQAFVSVYRDRDFTLVLFNADKKIVFVDKGRYTIKIVAKDEVGNFGIREFKVEVR